MNPRSFRQAAFIRQEVLAPVLIAVVIFAVYGGVLRFGFVWDDQYLIDYDKRFHSIDIPRFFSDYFFRGEYYRPITFLSFAIDWALHGNSPAGYHLTNLFVHFAVSLMLFFFLRRVPGNPHAALAGALLFAVHPVHVENIAFISARGDMLAALFFLLSIAAYARYRTGSDLGNSRWLAVSLAGYAAGLFSKEMAVTLPLVIVAYDILCTRKLGRPSSYAFFAGVAAAYFIVRYFAIGEMVGGVEGGGGGGMITPGILLAYLRLFALLDGGDIMPGISIPGSLFSTDVMVPAFTLMIVFSIAYLAGSKIPFFNFGALFIVITLFPVSNIIPLRLPLAARFAYIPSLGLAFCAAGLMWRFLQAERIKIKRTCFGVTALLMTVLAFVSFKRLPAWESNVSLWESVLERNPESTMAGWNLAQSYYDAGRYAAAVPLFGKFLTGDSADAPALKKIGECFMGMGKADSAVLIFRELITYDPRSDHFSLFARAQLALGDTLAAGENLIRAVKGRTGDAAAYIVLTAILLNKGLSDSADAVVKRIPDSPGLPEIFFAWGNDFLMQSQIRIALYFWRQSISVDSHFVPAYRNLASALAFLCENREAEEYYRRIVALQPDAADIYYHWAQIKATSGQIDSARILAAEAGKQTMDPALEEKIAAFRKLLDGHR